MPSLLRAVGSLFSSDVGQRYSDPIRPGHDTFAAAKRRQAHSVNRTMVTKAPHTASRDGSVLGGSAIFQGTPFGRV